LLFELAKQNLKTWGHSLKFEISIKVLINVMQRYPCGEGLVVDWFQQHSSTPTVFVEAVSSLQIFPCKRLVGSQCFPKTIRLKLSCEWVSYREALSQRTTPPAGTAMKWRLHSRDDIHGF